LECVEFHIAADRSVSYSQNTLEQRLHGQGLKLEELAVFALTLSDLFHKDAILDLEDLYDAVGVSTSNALSIDAMDILLMKHPMASVKGVRQSGRTPADFTKMDKDLEEFCTVWFESKIWIHH